MYQGMLNKQKVSDYYSSSWEHLQDELKRIKQLLRLEYIKFENKCSGRSSERYKGLAILKEEIEELLYEEDIEPDEALDDLKQEISLLELEIEGKRKASIENGTFLSLQYLSDLFGLSRFEEQCILFCMAVELEAKIGRVYAYLQDDMTRTNPSPYFIMELLNLSDEDKAAMRASFHKTSALQKYCIHMQENEKYAHVPLISREMFCDDRIINFLLESDQMDERLSSLARRIIPAKADIANLVLDEELKKRIDLFLKNGLPQIREAGKPMIFNFYGPSGAGKKSLVEYIVYHLKMPLLISDIKRFPENEPAFKELIWTLGREAMIQGAVLCIENIGFQGDEVQLGEDKFQMLMEMLRETSDVTFILGLRPWCSFDSIEEFTFLDIELGIPDGQKRRECWELYKGKSKLENEMDFGDVSEKFRLTPGQIKNAVSMVESFSLWNPPVNEKELQAVINKACHRQSNRKLSAVSRKIKPRYTWEDIILDECRKRQLVDVCGQVKYRYTVLKEWGFDRKLSYGKGLSVMFYGPPGTGKTMAAEVIANELGLELYKIDLSQVVSKYIGETEKNLQQIFYEAETSNAILFFDEADALFGKRSEVKDAHDRYANIEVAYLLQKMEEYDGITILATNMNSNLDNAFARRLSFSIEFPFPDVESRERIWRSVFTEAVPVSEDMDLSKVAKCIQMAGGNIKNIALSAAFLAAGEGQAVRMAHIVEAAKREYQKANKIWNEFQ